MPTSTERRRPGLVATSSAIVADTPAAERWPLHGSILLVVIASGLLWALIIATVLWLIG